MLVPVSPLFAQDFRQELAFHGNASAPDLVCPGRRSAASRPTAPPTDMVPPEELLRDDAINPEYAAAAPPALPAEVLSGFSLPTTPGRQLRIGVWGDSHVAAGFITDEMARVALGKGIDARTTFVPATVGRPGIRLGLKKVCKGDAWRFESAYIAPGQVRVGPGLATLRSTAVGSYLWLDMRGATWGPVMRVEILYAPVRAQTAAAIGVRVDEGGEVRFGLASEASELGPAVISLNGVTSLSTIKLRVLRGEFVLHGFRVTYDSRPALAIDVFGIPSATAKGWANVDVDYFRRSIGDASYDAVVLEYGTNEGAAAKFDSERYTATLVSSLRNLRAVFPSSACVLMGPTDRGVRIPRRARNRGKIDLLRYSRTHQEITRIQREVGAGYNCAVWDWQAYMGGAGAIYRWALRKPPLASSDLIHLTLAGYRQSAVALLNSLGWVTAPAASTPQAPADLFVPQRGDRIDARGTPSRPVPGNQRRD